MTLLECLKLKGPLAHSVRRRVADHLADLVFFIAGLDCFVERLPVGIFLELAGAEAFPIGWTFPRKRPLILHRFAEDMQSDKGMGFDPDAEEFSVAPRSGKMRHDKSLGAALVALNEGHARWRDVDIQSFFVWVLEIRSVGAKELSGGETKASGSGDLERSQTVNVWSRHVRYLLSTPQTTH